MAEGLRVFPVIAEGLSVFPVMAEGLAVLSVILGCVRECGRTITG